MTSRLEKITMTLDEQTLAELERQRRASAPTLRDLAAAYNNHGRASAVDRQMGCRLTTTPGCGQSPVTC